MRTQAKEHPEPLAARMDFLLEPLEGTRPHRHLGFRLLASATGREYHPIEAIPLAVVCQDSHSTRRQSWHRLCGHHQA